MGHRGSRRAFNGWGRRPREDNCAGSRRAGQWKCERAGEPPGGSEFKFARPRRVVGRHRRPLPDRCERDAFHVGSNGWRSRAPRARVLFRTLRICLSSLGAALAGQLDARVHLLPADLARDAFDGPPACVCRENLRGVKGPVLVVSNHVIYLDVGFVLASLPPRLRHKLAVAMGGERLAEMRRPPREWFFLRRWLHRTNYCLVVALFNVFPLPKRSGFRESFRFAGDLVDRGWSVLVFPEGDMTADGKLQPFRAGIGLLANNLKLPVVPIRIDGAYEIREARSRFNRPGRIRVHIGRPVEFPAASDPQQIARDLERRVAALGESSSEN